MSVLLVELPRTVISCLPICLSCALCRTLIPSSNNMNSLTYLHSTYSGQGASRRAPLFMCPFKAYPCLEGDVADGKADPSACHQLGQLSVLQYFWGMAGSIDHQHVFRQAGLSWQVLAKVVALFWQTGQGCEWQIIHDVGSVVCISTMWWLNFFLDRHWDVCLQAWAPPPPRFQNNDRFEMIHKIQKSDKYCKTLIFRYLSSWQNLKN